VDSCSGWLPCRCERGLRDGPVRTATTTTLATEQREHINAHAGPIKLQTKDSVEVFKRSTAQQPVIGWHVHTGSIIVNITAGR